MTAIAKLYFGVVIMEGGRSFSLGSFNAAMPVSKQVSGVPHIQRRMVIPQGGQAVLWDYENDSDTLDFALLAARIVGEGYARIGIFVDSPVSSSDLSPSGNHDHWLHRNLSCLAPMIFDTPRVLTHATAANLTADNGGVPALWTDANRVEGRIYKLVAQNTSSHEIKLDVLGVQA